MPEADFRRENAVGRALLRHWMSPSRDAAPSAPPLPARTPARLADTAAAVVQPDSPPYSQAPFGQPYTPCRQRPQDASHTIVRKLQLLLPDIKIWLDVDNLDDLGKLDKAVQGSAVVIVFLSKGYFRSANCRRELYAALGAGKPILAVQETDEDKGGASMEELMNECREYCVDEAPPSHPAYQGPDEVMKAIFLDLPPVIWVRVADFQLQSLKLLTQRVLLHLPYYKEDAADLAGGIKVAGELGPLRFSDPIRILTCAGNTGAQSVARELAAAAAGPGSASQVSLADAEEAFAADDGPTGTHTKEQCRLLVYLNEATFSDGHGGAQTCKLIKQALGCGVQVSLAHEQDPAAGGCSFRLFLEQAPEELQRPPYSLFQSVAVPLFPSAEHRATSLRHVLRGMGALPVHNRWAGARWLQQTRTERVSFRRLSAASAKWMGPIEAEHSATIDV